MTTSDSTTITSANTASANAAIARARRERVWLTRWQSRGWLVCLLYPVSRLFRLIAALRRWLYAHGLLAVYRPTVPVVVVGGIMIGGVGKTPIVAQLAQSLRRAGWQPVIISRGFGARASSVATQVMPNSLAYELGDEPVQLARHTGLPVFVGRARAEVARYALAQVPDCTVLLCDDGLQHYALARDVEIVITDDRGVGNGWCLPAGPLREPPSRLSTVDVVVCHQREGVERVTDSAALETTSGVNSGVNLGAAFQGESPKRIFTLSSGLQYAYALLDTASEHRYALNQFTLQTCAALAGIARPELFFNMLTASGVSLVKTWALPDHAPMDEGLASELLGCHSQWEVLLMTEKDAVKCADWGHLYPELAEKIKVVRLDLVQDASAHAFFEQVQAQLRTIRFEPQ